MSRRVLMLELNELCPSLIERFMAEGALPNFARLHGESVAYVTDAGEPQGLLNPWIQWVTAHTGVGFEEHRVFKLGEGADLGVPTVADVVGDVGGTVWLCGPMNVVPTKPVRGRWLPDPWNPDESAGLSDMAPFMGFVRANVQEHTNSSHHLGGGAYVRFLAFMARHGLSPSTARSVIRQLVGERTGRSQRWRRAALLDRFQWDMFRHYWEREEPQFATYFSNTTAHYQHLYWRYMEPEAFELKPTRAEVARYGDAIRCGYVEMDRLVGDALDLVDANTTLVFCSAISQQPYVLKDEEGGSRFYRPHDIAWLVEQLGITDVRKVAPVMSAQFHLLFSDEASAERAASVLEAATVDGAPAFDVRRVGVDVFTGFAITRDLDADAVIAGGATGAQIAVHDAFYRSETAKSGYHHREGAFWVRSPDRVGVTVPGVVSLRAVAPTLLSLMDIEAPETMRELALPTDPSVASQS